MLTLKEEMALAVLRARGGEDKAAYALADRLVAERMGLEEKEEVSGPPHSSIPGDGMEVFHWPETLAFLTRLGVDTKALIRSVEVKIAVGAVVTVNLSMLGEDYSDE